MMNVSVIKHWSPLLLWVALIFTGSSLPGQQIPDPVSQASVALHIFEYTVLYFTALRAFSSVSGINHKHLVVTAIVFCVLYSMSDEIHQVFVPGRRADGWDVVADTLGIVVGVISVYWWKRVKLV